MGGSPPQRAKPLLSLEAKTCRPPKDLERHEPENAAVEGALDQRAPLGGLDDEGLSYLDTVPVVRVGGRHGGAHGERYGVC